MLYVPSETAVLKEVIVHTPGPEVSKVNPEIKDDLLFDDIIFETDARQEHLDMLKIFQVAMGKKGRIHEIIDLTREVFTQEDAKAFFVERLIKTSKGYNLYPLEKELLALEPDEMVRFIIEGTTERLPHVMMFPSPNLLFTRDLAAVVGNSIVVSKAAKEARWRESLITNTLIRFHPLFESIRDNAIHVGGRNSIEGGDILVAAPNIAMIGMSERTSFSALHSVAEQLLDHGMEYIVAVDIPKQRASMHLDTIFTFTSPTECLVFPPSISDMRHNVVVLYRSGDHVASTVKYNLQQTLNELMGREITFINCGGADRTNQFREQWTDGANSFALAPGVIVGYERNIHTFEALKEHGYEIWEQFEFIEEFGKTDERPDFTGRKMAIHFMGHELCRGRGGARCMTMPISREASSQ